ncbi:MAG: hypothetical protein ABT940_04160 [Alphaproteobacteria bacterium]
MTIWFLGERFEKRSTVVAELAALGCQIAEVQDWNRPETWVVISSGEIFDVQRPEMRYFLLGEGLYRKEYVENLKKMVNILLANSHRSK